MAELKYDINFEFESEETCSLKDIRDALAIAEHVNATNESLSDFIRRAITETMERDKASPRSNSQ